MNREISRLEEVFEGVGWDRGRRTEAFQDFKLKKIVTSQTHLKKIVTSQTRRSKKNTFQKKELARGWHTEGVWRRMLTQR